MNNVKISLLPKQYHPNNFITVDCTGFGNINDSDEITYLGNEILRLMHENQKNSIVFSVISEGLPYNQISTIQRIVSFLLTTNNYFTLQQFRIVSGATPCAENLKFYRDHCKRFGWHEVPITFINWWEITRQRIIDLYGETYNQIDTTPRVKGKKFLCYNRMCKMHRLYITTETIKRGLLDKAYFSNYFTLEKDGPNLGAMHEFLPTTYLEVISLLHEHKDLFPIDLGLNTITDQSLMADKSHALDINDLEHYNNSYFAIVTETKFFNDNYEIKNRLYGELSLDCYFFTEKTYKFIQAKFPFILAGINGSLEMLRKMGYKTFHPYIDETYDTIQDDELRLKAIMDEVERLSNLSDEEMVKWQENILPILEHNYNVLASAGEQTFTYLPNL
jgi:hypothetical protein